MNEYLAALLFFLPAGIANVVPPLANKVPGLNQWKTPLDFGKSINKKRVFGDNKTWRGLVSGTIVAMFAAVIIGQFNTDLIGSLNLWFIGFLLGFGALIGDALESFIKRQMNIKPGDSWFPFDQIDYIVAGLLFVSLSVQLTTNLVLAIFLVYFCLHLIVSYLGNLLGFKDKPI